MLAIMNLLHEREWDLATVLEAFRLLPNISTQGKSLLSETEIYRFH
jgi:hypothetical protein